MKLTSSAFEYSGTIPKKYTCDGENVSPPLTISDVPHDTVSLALIVDDPDVPTFVREDGIWDHWIVYNIPASTTTVKEGEPPNGIVGVNTEGKAEYHGPCPPDGEHRYFFKLYALNKNLEFTEPVSKQALLEAMHGFIIAQTELVGVYRRNT